MATLLSNKKSSYGSPYAFYTATVSVSSRTTTSVKITFKITAKLQYSESWLGTGHGLIAGIKVAGSWHTVTLKSSSSSWSGTKSHSASTSFTVSAAATTATLTGIQVRVYKNSGAPTNAARLNATNVSNISIGTAATSSTPSLSGGTTFGSVLTITNDSIPSSNVYTVKYTFGSATGTICTKQKSPVNWTIPNTLMNQIPSSTSGTLTIECSTYTSGGSLVGTKSATRTITVPSSVVPNISSLSVSDATSMYSTFGTYLKGQSKVKVVAAASGAYGSSISSYSTTVAGLGTYSGSSFTSGLLNTTGSVRITTTVKDSRGRSASTYKEISVTAYSPPGITSIDAYMCDAEGNKDPAGTCAYITVVGRTEALSGNTRTVTIQYKDDTAPSWTTVTSPTISGSPTFTATKLVSGLDPSKSYTFQAKVADVLYSTDYKAVRLSAIPISVLAGGKGVKLFGEATDEGFWVGNIDYTISDDEFDELMSLLGA